LECAQDALNVKWSPSLTFSEFLNSCTKRVSIEIGKVVPISSNDLKLVMEYLDRSNSLPKNPINVARNHFIRKEYAKKSPKGNTYI